MKKEQKTHTLHKIEKMIAPNSKIIYGLSGGPDSIFLLHHLLKLREKLHLEIIAAHINHNVRKNSKKDAQFCKKYCKENNIIFEIYTLINPPKQNFEERARELRYAFFSKLLRQYDADSIVTAHNANDNLETLLYRLIKGTGLKGLGGIASSQQILRPIIHEKKCDILKYLTSHEIPYCKDETNDDTKYARNFIRKEIVPRMEKINPQMVKNGEKYSAYFSELYDFINKESRAFLQKAFKTNKFSITSFNRLHPAIQREVLMIIFNTQKIQSARRNISFTEIDELKQLLNEKKHTIGSLAGQKYQTEYDTFIFGEKSNPIHTLKVTLLKKKPKHLNKDEFLLGIPNVITEKQIKVRTFEKGDKISPLGMGGKSKKLSDVFTDKKVPKALRENIPVLLIKNEIAAVGHLVISEKYKVTSETSAFLKVRLEEKN